MSNEQNGGQRGVAKTVIESAITGPPAGNAAGWGQPAAANAAPQQASWGQPATAQAAAPQAAAQQAGWGQSPGQNAAQPVSSGGAQQAGGQQGAGQQGWGQPSGQQQGWGQGAAAGQTSSAASGGGQSWGQSGGGGGGGGQQNWAAPPGGGGNRKSGGGKGCLVIAVLGTLLLGMCGVGGYFAYTKFNGAQNALITDSAVVENVATGQAHVQLTIEFVEELPEGDAMNVNLHLQSADAMANDIDLDWAWIASNDQLAETMPNLPPPLNTPLIVFVPIESALFSEVYFDSNTDRIKIQARLEWGGVHQDTARPDATSLYDNPMGLTTPQVPIPMPGMQGMVPGGMPPGMVPPAGMPPAGMPPTPPSQPGLAPGSKL